MSYRELWRAVVFEAEMSLIYPEPHDSEVLRQIHFDNLALDAARCRLERHANAISATITEKG